MPSLVWIHFKTLNSVHAECKYCGAVLNVANGSTKGLWTHVSRKHPQEHLSYNYETEETEKEMQEVAKRPKGSSLEDGDVAIPKRRRRKKEEDTNSVGAVLRSALLAASMSKESEENEESAGTSEEVNLKVKKECPETSETSKEEPKEPSKEVRRSRKKKKPVKVEELFEKSVKLEIAEEEENADEERKEEGEGESSWREELKRNGYSLTQEMEQSGNDPTPSLSIPQMNEAFRATVTRDYERAIAIVRAVVKTEHMFTAEDLELLDHIFACVLNTSHYDETMIEVCWEWIDAFERPPRTIDIRVIASSQLSIYFAYHTICRVQERMPRKPNYPEIRRKTWARIVESFEYLYGCASNLWKPAELDRLDILVNWSYLGLQYADACDDGTIVKLKEAKEEVAEHLVSSVLLENCHQANERVSTLERNIHDVCTRRGTTINKIVDRSETSIEPQEKKPRMVDG